jgi:large subunit ribosomal protein L6
MPKKLPRKDILVEIEIPEGITAEIKDKEIIIKKADKELKKKLDQRVSYKIKDNKITLEVKKSTKKERKIFGTMKAHINNMILGLTTGFTYKLEIANVHFPMTVSHDKENSQLVIKNFLGEKKNRNIKLVEGIEIKIDKQEIRVQSIDIEKAGQCAANIEKGTKVKNKDRRIFQDGIFIVEKPGRNYL